MISPMPSASRPPPLANKLRKTLFFQRTERRFSGLVCLASGTCRAWRRALSVQTGSLCHRQPISPSQPQP
jgi:hypothetical protein